jgi:DNA-binding beta-propeller fold protein YncE
MLIPSTYRLLTIALCIAAAVTSCSKPVPVSYTKVVTLAGANSEFGEPFGIAVKGEDTYVSDGADGRIFKVGKDGLKIDFTEGFETPSGIAFAKNGDIIVADSGSHTIKSVSTSGEVKTIAGTDGKAGSIDGNALTAMFNGPIGIAVAEDGKIFVSDTYNDRIRVIDKGQVSTLAGNIRGFRDGRDAQFDTPIGLAMWRDKLLVADADNRRIRVIEPDGFVWTLAGNGEEDLKDGPLPEASFVRPTVVAVNERDQIFVADGNAVRVINGRGVFPYVVTLAGGSRGFRDGIASRARFNRPSGLAFSSDGSLLIADSENGFVRMIGGPAINSQNSNQKQYTADEFKKLQPPRWPYDPPEAARDVAGTLGELRGTVGSDVPLRFHNGLDIAGAYGETARFIRSEKVLDPISTENFGDLRELIRLPQIGYIHIRLGRDQNDRMLPNSKFQPQFDAAGKMIDIRVPRGTKFEAGEPIGTLNAMNHVHLIAGPSGGEINALAALELPGIKDSIAPTIENAAIFDQNWLPVETKPAGSRIKLAGKYRVVVRAFDRMDGNSDRRRLGVYKLGFQVFQSGGSPIGETIWSIVFDRMPPNYAAKFVYAAGSHSGATGETIFNYVVTNRLDGDKSHEDFFDTNELPAGNYTIRVFAGDYFGNISTKDIPIEVIK